MHGFIYASRFCFGSTKLMKVALGQAVSTEYQDGLAEVSKMLKGTVGLFFTSLSKAEASPPTSSFASAFL